MEEIENEEMKMFQNLDLIPEMITRQNDLLNQLNEVKKSIEGQKQIDVSSDLYRKIYHEVSEAVSHTKCKLPDPNLLSSSIASELIPHINDHLERIFSLATYILGAKELTLKDIWTRTDKITRNWIIGLAATIIFLISLIVFSHVWYFNSNAYWNAEYAEILSSGKLSDKEVKNVLEIESLGYVDLIHPMQLCPSSRQENIQKFSQMAQNKLKEESFFDYNIDF